MTGWSRTQEGWGVGASSVGCSLACDGLLCGCASVWCVVWYRGTEDGFCGSSSPVIGGFKEPLVGDSFSLTGSGTASGPSATGEDTASGASPTGSGTVNGASHTGGGTSDGSLPVGGGTLC